MYLFFVGFIWLCEVQNTPVCWLCVEITLTLWELSDVCAQVPSQPALALPWVRLWQPGRAGSVTCRCFVGT